MQRTYHLDLTPHTALAPEIAQRLSQRGQRRRFSAGSWVQQRGDDGNGFWLIEGGRVAVCRHGIEGEQTIFAVLGAGDLFGELAYFAGTARQVDAIAQVESVLAWIGDGVIRQMLADDPGFAASLLASLANQLRTALNRIDIARHGRAETRLAAALIDMAGDVGGRIVCTQQELSGLIGVSRVRTGALLAQFARDALIVRGYGWIDVVNPGAIRAYLPQ